MLIIAVHHATSRPASRRSDNRTTSRLALLTEYLGPYPAQSVPSSETGQPTAASPGHCANAPFSRPCRHQGGGGVSRLPGLLLIAAYYPLYTSGTSTYEAGYWSGLDRMGLGLSTGAPSGWLHCGYVSRVIVPSMSWACSRYGGGVLTWHLGCGQLGVWPGLVSACVGGAGVVQRVVGGVSALQSAHAEVWR